MYRLVLTLPFNILLVHSWSFETHEEAWHFKLQHYPLFSLEVWSTTEVSTWKGSVVYFPIVTGDVTNER